MAILRIRDEYGNVHEVVALKGEKGADGTVSFDELTDEQKASLKGEKGADGTVSFDELTEEQKASLKGERGATGEAGVGIESAAIVNGELALLYTDGTGQTVGKVVGDKGEDGKVPEDYGNNKFANALKGTDSGLYSVRAVDVSPIEHDVVVKVSRKNLFNNKAKVETVTFLNSKGDATVDRLGYSISLPAGTYTVCATLKNDAEYKNDYIYHKAIKADGTQENINTIGNPVSEGTYGQDVNFIINQPFTYLIYAGDTSYSEDKVLKLFNKFDIILERGTETTGFTPYIEDLSKVEITTAGDGVNPPMTYHPNADGMLTVKSTECAMEFSTGNDVYMELAYNRDINKVIERLEKASAQSQGGNV